MGNNKKKLVEILPNSYEPTKEEKISSFVINVTPQKLAKAIIQPVNIKKKDIKKHIAERSKSKK